MCSASLFSNGGLGDAGPVLTHEGFPASVHQLLAESNEHVLAVAALHPLGLVGSEVVAVVCGQTVVGHLGHTHDPANGNVSGPAVRMRETACWTAASDGPHSTPTGSAPSRITMTV